MDEHPSGAGDPSPPRQRNRRGEGGQLRQEIVRSASGLLAEHGNEESLSLRAVARNVGVAATSVYLHFPDKPALVRAVLEERYALLAGEMAAAAEGAGTDPFRRLMALSRAYCHFAVEHPGHYRLLYEISTHPTGTGTESHPGYQLLTLFRRAVQVCIEAGAAPPGGAGAHVTTLCVWSSLHGLVSLRASKPTVAWPPLAEQIDHTVAALVGAAGRSRPG